MYLRIAKVELSDRGLKHIEESEGCRLKAYQDTGGVWTIGYGHTGGVREGQVITETVATDLLRHDLAYAEGIVNEKALPATQGQFDALVDFVFNVGPTQFLSSHLYAYHKEGSYKQAAAEFPKWKFDNGKVIPGLVIRRQKERDLYEA
jgi:lysozyme